MSLWVGLGLGIASVVYIVLRLAYIWFFCGGNSGSSNYYSDSEK